MASENQEKPQLPVQVQQQPEYLYDEEATMAEIAKGQALLRQSKAIFEKFLAHGVAIDQFEHVNGRLTMTGCQVKYPISTAEVRRRTSAPEFLNSSSIAGLLRRCKVKNCGEDMRNKLKQHGIEMTMCRRKGIPATALTGMSEGELLDFSKDFETITRESYPNKAIAKCITDKVKTHREQQEIVDDANEFMAVMAHFMVAANSCQPALTGMAERRGENAEFAEAMDTFSKVTHGFGTQNHKTWTEQLLRIGTELCDYVPTAKPDQIDVEH
ncbi:unnamed protein product [Caenorhabditis angaria]|uniref:Transcription factor AP-2 C-terminal domain-containing protein n=1 Tax=Caenorhabditis angaria TaxID=860376 RepID=A0A9P1N4U9_9PELO|nr:unnamed protein product [Caenorhabditis angaria]